MALNEELFEDGIVEKIEKEKLLVRVTPSGGCEECSAKIYCNPSSDKGLVYVKNEAGVEIGDKVRIALPGKNIVNASTFIYGLPLLILCAGMLAGNWLFISNKEFYSSILSLVLIALYGGIIYFAAGRNECANLPRIVSVKKPDD